MGSWTWQDTLEHFREEKDCTTTFDYLQAMAEQIEANRLAIQELRREQKAHWPDWRHPGDA